MHSLIFSLGILDNITKPIGKIFQPLLDFVASILAFFYSIIPNYPISIALLTIVIMAVLTPLTVKSTKSMAAMQALGPEMKKLQQKYKGAENRAQLNEEMMKLYKEHKVNPASGCLPMVLQLPAFLVLYDVIRGITNTVQVHGHTVAQPRYIPHNTAMYHDIIAGHGALNSFGMDFAKKLLPFSSHSSIWATLPYLFLVLASIGLQYLQMSRLSKRNPAASANPQAAMLQKYMPIVFGLIYLNIPAAVNVYFIVSSAIRIGTQEVLFRRGIVGAPPARAEEKETPGRKPKPGSGPRSGTATRERPTTRPKTGSGSGSGQRPSGSGQRPSSGSGGSGTRPRPKTGSSPSTRNGSDRPAGARPAGSRPAGTKGTSGETKGTSSGRPAGARPTRRSGTGSGTGSGSGSGSHAGSGNGSKSPNGTGRSRPGSPRGTAKSSGNGATSNGDGNGESEAPKAHPRSKSKRDRKAR